MNPMVAIFVRVLPSWIWEGSEANLNQMCYLYAREGYIYERTQREILN